MRLKLSIVFFLSIALATAAFAADGDRTDRPAPREGGDRANPRRPEGDRPAEGARRERAQQLGGPFEHLTGLTDEQKTKILEIRRKYEELQRKQQEELMAVLTEEQRQEFSRIIGRGRERNENRPVRPDEPGRERGEARPEVRPDNGEGAAPTVPAIITKVEVPNLWIKIAGRDEPIKVSADEKTVITLGGKPTTFAELKVGQHVQIQHPTGTAARIEIQSEKPEK